MLEENIFIIKWRIEQASIDNLQNIIKDSSFSKAIIIDGKNLEKLIDNTNSTNYIISGFSKLDRIKRELNVCNLNWTDKLDGNCVLLKKPSNPILRSFNDYINSCTIGKGVISLFNNLNQSNGRPRQSDSLHTFYKTPLKTISYNKNQQGKIKNLRSCNELPRNKRLQLDSVQTMRGKNHDFTSKRILSEKYACQRKAPLICENEEFVDCLRQIKFIRELQGDQIAVRAYSSAISALKCVLFPIQARKQLENISGCGGKVIYLWEKFSENSTIEDLNPNSVEFEKLKLFWSIWGVGPATARKWVVENKWSDIQQVRDHFNELPRNIQFGLKYYEDFLKKMDRAEIEQIANIIIENAKIVIETLTEDSALLSHCIVGGYRRGNEFSSDCDMIITHPKCFKKADLLLPLLKRLEDEKMLNVVLTLQSASTGKHHNGSVVIVTLLDVYSPIHTNLHRRVDLIITPPRYYGTCIIGWSGSITFERDLRRYVKEKFNWRFDSTGIYEISTSFEVDVDYDWRPNQTPEDCERVIFHLLELEYIPAIYRNHD